VLAREPECGHGVARDIEQTSWNAVVLKRREQLEIGGKVAKFNSDAPLSRLGKYLDLPCPHIPFDGLVSALVF
jgi:hypothetical protein